MLIEASNSLLTIQSLLSEAAELAEADALWQRQRQLLGQFGREMDRGCPAHIRGVLQGQRRREAGASVVRGGSGAASALGPARREGT